MKRALIEISSNRIAQVVALGADFQVSSGLRWLDCVDDVTPETYTFDGVNFIAKPAAVVFTVDQSAALKVDGVDRLQFDVMFVHENAIRTMRAEINALDAAAVPPRTATFTLAQASQITQAQFRDALIARWKVLNP